MKARYFEKKCLTDNLSQFQRYFSLVLAERFIYVYYNLYILLYF